MKNVAIMTIHSLNLGNRLQNYALQNVLEGLDCHVETVQRDYAYDMKSKGIYRIIDLLRMLVGTRRGLYLKFDKNIHFSRFHASIDRADDGLRDGYDMFIAGSDQVWNPLFDTTVGSCDLLTFCDDKKKYAYSASFGIEEIPDQHKASMADALKGFQAISVREASGARIVKELIGREVPVTLDPTLLLKAGQWAKLERKPSVALPEKYAMLYHLDKSFSMPDDVHSSLRDRGIEVFDVFSTNKRGKRIAIGPAEFIYLVDHAECVITDSFHATVFSMIFHKPVRTYPRTDKDMFSRIISLASMLGIEECIQGNQLFAVDSAVGFQAIEQRVDLLRGESIAYLRKIVSAKGA